MRISVSNVTLSVPCYRTHARVITFLPVFLWRVTNRVCLDNDLRVLVPAVGVNLEEIIENHKRNAATYKTLGYTSHDMLKFSNCCCEQINARNVSCLGVE